MPPDLLDLSSEYEATEMRIFAALAITKEQLYGHSQGLDHIRLQFDLRAAPPTLWQILMGDD